MTESHISNYHMGCLSPLLNQPYMLPLIKKYLESLPELITNLRDNYNIEDYEELRFLVHKLVGAASNFGFIKLSQHAKDIENHLDKGIRGEVISEKMEILIKLIKEVIEVNSSSLKE